jgi:hypothetical protein
LLEVGIAEGDGLILIGDGDRTGRAGQRREIRKTHAVGHNGSAGDKKAACDGETRVVN